MSKTTPIAGQARKASSIHPPSPGSAAKWSGALICFLLVLATIAVYSPVRHAGFLTYDDPDYLTENPWVQSGLNGPGLKWALTTTHGGNWHPITWLAHMVNYQLYGLNPLGHHLTNVFFHIANGLLFFGLFRRMTGALWRSAFVAALFALHPLRVQSVAWVAELKDVLSTFFFLLTLWAYARYAEAKTESGRRQTEMVSVFSFQFSAFYWLALLFFALCLMCKQMAVTLPFLLLLLDYWPLRRFQLAGAAKRGEAGSAFQRFSISAFQFLPLRRLLLEKIPFLLLALLPAAIQFRAVQESPLNAGADLLPFTPRVQNALVSYFRYLRKTVWPDDLAVFYQHPGTWPFWQVVGAALFLVLVSVLIGLASRRKPYLLMGWLWFLGMLVPVIGLIYQGVQAMADRYAYVPLVGVYIMIVWLLADFAGQNRKRRFALSLIGAVVLALFAGATFRQVGYWTDGIRLFQHALKVAPPNPLVYGSLAKTYFFRRDFASARRWFEAELKLDPASAMPYINLGSILCEEGKLEEGIEQFALGVKHARDAKLRAVAENNWAVTLLRLGRPHEAIPHLKAAADADPNYSFARVNLGDAYVAIGKSDDAIAEYQAALRLKPNDAHTRSRLGSLFLAQRNNAAAAEQFRMALTINPNAPEAHFQMAKLLVQTGEMSRGIHHLREALRLRPDWPVALNELAWILSTHPTPTYRNGQEALRLAEQAVKLTGGNVVPCLDTLAAAHAENGNFVKAIEFAKQALAEADAAGQKELAEDIRKHLASFESGQPLRE